MTNPRVAVPTYGRDLIAALPKSLLERPVVHAAPEPWALVRHLFPDSTQVHFVQTMEHDTVRAVSDGFAPGSAVFGIGGGSALDSAKYTAIRRNLPLVLVPSILSVDAAYTKAVGVREGSRVRYTGAVYPEHLLIDFGLLQAAPKVLNVAGTGDILSIFTALWDWREAHTRNGEAYNADIAREAQAALNRLYAGARDIGACNDAGLHLLSELFVEEVRLCEIVGNARPEEGSEHYIAYCLESITQKHYIHGRLIGLCILIAGLYQGQDITAPGVFLREAGLDVSYEAVGTSRAEITAVLRRMGAYVREESQLLPGVFHFFNGIGDADIERVLDGIGPWSARA